MTVRRDRPGAGDDGTVLVLVIGVVVVLGLLMAVVADSARLYLAARALDSVTDGAALAGAQSADLAAVYSGSATRDVPIDPAAARAAVDRYVEASSASSLHGFEVTGVTVDGDRVRVTTRAEVRLPFVGPVTHGRSVIVVTSFATATDHVATP